LACSQDHKALSNDHGTNIQQETDTEKLFLMNDGKKSVKGRIWLPEDWMAVHRFLKGFQVIWDFERVMLAPGGIFFTAKDWAKTQIISGVFAFFCVIAVKKVLMEFRSSPGSSLQ
jgi:hypothetical protein